MATYSYLDSSAIVKLVAREAETSALENALAHSDGLLTSRVSVIEVTRAARRAGARTLLQRADDVLSSFVLVELSPAIATGAAAINPLTLRSLDALHLATAASLAFKDQDQLEFICYDDRLSSAARRAGLTCRAPA